MHMHREASVIQSEVATLASVAATCNVQTRPQAIMASMAGLPALGWR